MDDPFLFEIVERRGELQPERQQLLRFQDPLLPDHTREAGALEVLEDEMRPRAVEHGVEAAHDDGMS